MHIPSKFKDSGGRWLTQSLFRECYVKGATPLYTMGSEDHVSEAGVRTPSFSRLYLELLDPTEYKVATTLLGGLRHWEILVSLSWFKDYVEALRAELDVKIKSIAIDRIKEEASGNSKGALQAAKWLAEGHYRPGKRGRPTKAEKAAELRRQESTAKTLQQDAERIGLILVKDSNG